MGVFAGGGVAAFSGGCAAADGMLDGGGVVVGKLDGADGVVGGGVAVGKFVGAAGVVVGKLNGVAAGACALVRNCGKLRQTRKKRLNIVAICVGDEN
jgi:hypothetical protein